MNNYFCFYYLATTVVLAACSSEPISSEATVKRPVIATLAPASSEEKAPAQTVRKFLIWHSQQQEALNSLPFVPASLDEDTLKVYTIDFQTVDRYIHTLQSSGYFSPAYLQQTKRYFRQCQDSLQAHAQTDGPPEGLNYDRFLYTQAAEQQAHLLLQSQPTSQTAADTAQVVYRWKENQSSEGPDLAFSLVRLNTQWLIKAIRPVTD